MTQTVQELEHQALSTTITTGSDALCPMFLMNDVGTKTVDPIAPLMVNTGVSAIEQGVTATLSVILPPKSEQSGCPCVRPRTTTGVSPIISKIGVPATASVAVTTCPKNISVKEFCDQAVNPSYIMTPRREQVTWQPNVMSRNQYTETLDYYPDSLSSPTYRDMCVNVNPSTMGNWSKSTAEISTMTGENGSTRNWFGDASKSCTEEIPDERFITEVNPDDMMPPASSTMQSRPSSFLIPPQSGMFSPAPSAIGPTGSALIQPSVPNFEAEGRPRAKSNISSVTMPAADSETMREKKFSMAAPNDNLSRSRKSMPRTSNLNMPRTSKMFKSTSDFRSNPSLNQNQKTVQNRMMSNAGLGVLNWTPDVVCIQSPN
ncbi:uncharacterized protein LOC113363003 [Ctenocephalides felis]|uniref:uncharacterized protein LOC113363003 n=1 Tax=Ctenocephalides felis TaxID=7515 RepID=UPI000E6E23E6|nr:uncharacterized protein LOC113363003 [Ctenocephalides felis]